MQALAGNSDQWVRVQTQGVLLPEGDTLTEREREREKERERERERVRERERERARERERRQHDATGAAKGGLSVVCYDATLIETEVACTTCI